MATPETGLGFPTSFNSTAFRNAITGAMQMGAPPNATKRAKFIKKSDERTFWKNGVKLATAPRQGRDGQPLDPDVEVRTQAPVIVSDANCAIEVERADADELPVGNFRQTKAVVTLLDVDYAKVQGCKELIYNGDRYLYGYEPEALGMFDVGVHTIIYYAVDES